VLKNLWLIRNPGCSLCDECAYSKAVIGSKLRLPCTRKGLRFHEERGFLDSIPESELQPGLEIIGCSAFSHKNPWSWDEGPSITSFLANTDAATTLLRIEKERSPEAIEKAKQYLPNPDEEPAEQYSEPYDGMYEFEYESANEYPPELSKFKLKEAEELEKKSILESQKVVIKRNREKPLGWEEKVSEDFKKNFGK